VALELADLLLVVPVLDRGTGSLGVDVELLDVDVDVLDDLVQAAHALPDGPAPDVPGDQDPLHDRLEPQIEVELAPGGDADHGGTEILRRRNAPSHLTHRPRAAAELMDIEHERRTGVEGDR